MNSPALYVDIFLACFSQVAKVAMNENRRTGLHWRLGIVARFVIKSVLNNFWDDSIVD